MPRTILPTISASRAGAPVSFTTSDQVNGNAFANAGATFLMVRNTGGTPVNVTIRTNRFEDQDLKLPDRVIAVPASTASAPAFMLGPFDPGIYNQADGTTVNLDAAASLLFAVMSPQ